MKTIRHILATLLLALPAGLSAQDTEIWVTLPDNPNRESNGIYGFPANDPQAITARKTAPELYFQKGTGYQDGVIYGMDYQQGFFSPDRYILYAVDTKTWTVSQQDVDKSLALKETACGMDGMVYALFDDGQLGTLDYQQLKRTDICQPRRSFVALGVSSLGELYGIDSQANLVRIATDNGSETVIGQLGINVGSGTTGEIDPVSNLFYLAVNTNVYAVDLQTCKVTYQGQLPAGFSYLGGMIIVGEAVGSGTPAKATDLTASFEGTSLSGTIAFTAPTETFNHQPLEGTLTYTVSYGTDGQYTLTGTTEAGEHVELPVILTEGGNITFSVKLANSAGEGQTASISLWVGPDAPLAPRNVQLSMTAGGEATLTWTAPTACVNGGYLGTLTYNVWRIVSGEETFVAEGISENSFSERHEISALKEYSYVVVAVNEGTPSERATSNKVILGDGFGVPFVEHFGTGNYLEYFTVNNVNDDSDRWGELTWKLHEDLNYWGAGKNYEEMTCPTDGLTDDWLITPPIRLEPGQVYALHFKMKAAYEENPEKFEVCMGRMAEVESMTITLLREQTITNTLYKSYLREFTVDEAGSYCFGFHATPNKGVGLFLDDIEVRVNATQDAPSQVFSLNIRADETGKLTTHITFNAPSNAISGESLQNLTKIEVLRDELLVATIESPMPGSFYELTDNTPVSGYYTYTIIPYNNQGNGMRTELRPIYVGVDVPLAPQITRTVDKGNTVYIEWSMGTDRGENGYVVRLNDIVYEVYSTNAAGQKDMLLYEGKDCAIESSYEDTEDFDIAKWLIIARNEAGMSRAAAAKIATGRPLLLPYRETFSMGHLKTSIWTEQTGLRSWNPTTEDASDGDAGSLLYVPYKYGDKSSYNTQRLSFAGVKQPHLSFSCKMPEESLIGVYCWTPNGTTWEACKIWGNDKWERHEADLTMFKNEPYVVLKFIAEGRDGDHILIDDVRIDDGAYADDIVQYVALPTQQKGQPYDLQGRRVTRTTKGLYIVNGKKLIK